MSQSNQKYLSDITQGQVIEIAAYLDQWPSSDELYDVDGIDSASDEYWRRLVKRLAKVDRRYSSLVERSYIRSLEKEAWELKSPSLKLLATLKERRLELELFRSCLEHKDVGCTAVINVLKNGAQTPRIVAQPQSCEVDVGKELKLVCRAECTYPLQYQWYNEQEPLPMSNSDTYIVQHVDHSHTGRYTCRVRNPSIADGKSAFVFSQTAEVIVLSPGAPIQETDETHSSSETDSPSVQAAPTATAPSPRPLVITTQPQPLKVPYGSEARLSCTPEGLPGQVITYEWYKGGAMIHSGTSGDHVITGGTCEDEGQYHCVVSCGGYKGESNRVNLEVELDEADRIIITEQPQRVCARVNETITLKCKAHNNSGKELVYEWFRDNKPAIVHTGPELTLHLNYKRQTKLKYYCKISLKDSCKKFVKSAHAEITVDILWFTIQPNDVIGYLNKPVVLYCKAEGLPGASISYIWLKSSSRNGPFLPLPATNDTLIIERLADRHLGHYACQASDESIFTQSQPASVTLLDKNEEERAPPVIRITQQPLSRAVKEGKNFNLVCRAIASSGDVVYQWYRNGSILEGEQKETLSMVARSDTYASYYCLVKTLKMDGGALSETARVSVPIEDEIATGVPSEERSYKTEDGHFAQEKVALLIGNGHYKEMEHLKAVENDIRNLRETLAELGFKVMSLVDLNLKDMLRALEQFYNCLCSGVYAVFYYSGHGFNCMNNTYLVPTDAKTPLICNENISSKLILSRIQEKGAFAISLLDCCKVSEGSVQQPLWSDADESLIRRNNYIEISACHDGFKAYADESGSIFNKALIPCIKEKVKVNKLDRKIIKKIRSLPSVRPSRRGTFVHNVTLHDPIMLLDEEAEKNINSLSLQYSKANSVPEPLKLTIRIENSPECVQLQLSFSAEFSNVLQVKIRPVDSSNISVTKIVIDEDFMNAQNVTILPDQFCGGTLSFKIMNIERAKELLKLCMKVTVRIDGQEQCVTCTHKFEEKFLFSSLT